MVHPVRAPDLEELETEIYRRNSWSDDLYMGVLYDSVPNMTLPIARTDVDFKAKYLAELMPLSK